MPHLQTEFQRLYLPPAATSGQLIDDQGLTRALVLEVGGPANWDLLGAVWRGVQAELEWPALGSTRWRSMSAKCWRGATLAG